MLKLKRAVFCYYILRFDRRLHTWLIMIQNPLARDGFLTIDDADRKRVAKWISDLFSKQVDFDTVLTVLVGDIYFDQNKADVAKLEAAVGRRVIDLWDTDPIFKQFPHLKTLARNKEFEMMWAKMKSDKRQKQK